MHAVHAAVQAIDHATRAVLEVQRLRDGASSLSSNALHTYDARFREELASLVDGLADHNSQNPPTESASLNKIRHLARSLHSLAPEEVNLAILSGLNEELPAIAGLVNPAAMEALRAAIRAYWEVKEDDLLVDSLGRLEEARLEVSNASLGFVPMRGPAERVWVGIDQAINDAQRELRSLALAHHVEFRNSLGAARTYAPCVVDDVRRLFMNLLHNALKYSDALRPPKRAWVRCAAAIDDSCLKLEFESWGTGVASDELERIFEAGARGRAAARGGRTGAGLGLLIARRVCLNHGWAIRLRSRPAVPGKDNVMVNRFVTTAEVLVPRELLWDNPEGDGPVDSVDAPLPG